MFFPSYLKWYRNKTAGVKILFAARKQTSDEIIRRRRVAWGRGKKNCVHTTGQTQILKTYSVSVPVCLYFEPSWALYLPAADRKDHLFRHTVLNPGWFVTQFGLVSTSWRTISLPSESMHFSISWQHWHSLEFCKYWRLQLPHLHLKIQ